MVTDVERAGSPDPEAGRGDAVVDVLLLLAPWTGATAIVTVPTHNSKFLADRE